jgi:hypothetical protein
VSSHRTSAGSASFAISTDAGAAGSPVRVTTRTTLRAISLPWKFAATNWKSDTGGAPSSSRIVPCPSPSEMTTLNGWLRLTKKVSSGSTAVSPTTATDAALTVSPGRKVMRPVAALKSAPCVAVPGAAVNRMRSVLPLAAESVRLKTALVVPELPSVTLASPAETVGVASSSRIVTGSRSPTSPLAGFWRAMKKLSSGSSSRSPKMRTLTDCSEAPGAKVRRPEAASKSLPAAAVPAKVA